MDWARGLLIASSLGFAVAMVLRIIPQVRNSLVPKVGYITILLANIMLLWQKFLESAGLATASLQNPDASIAYASFFSFLKPVVMIVQPIAISFVQYFVNRLIHEGAVKPVFFNKEPTMPVVTVTTIAQKPGVAGAEKGKSI
jgi:hypothetical protein